METDTNLTASAGDRVVLVCRVENLGTREVRNKSMLHRRFFIIIIIKFIFILLNFIFFFGDLNLVFAYMIHTMDWKQVLTKISLNMFMHVVTELFILYI